MPPARFYTSFLLLSVLTALLLLGGINYTNQQAYLDMAAISLLYFMLLSWIMYKVGDNLSRKEDHFGFTNLILVFTFFKIISAVALVFIYVQLRQPASNGFLIIFLIVYFVYTVYETYFMMKL